MEVHLTVPPSRLKKALYGLLALVLASGSYYGYKGFTWTYQRLKAAEQVYVYMYQPVSTEQGTQLGITRADILNQLGANAFTEGKLAVQKPAPQAPPMSPAAQK